MKGKPKKKYNVLMACGAGFRGVTYKPTESDLQHPFRVYDNARECRRPEYEDGKKAFCLDCKCRRKAKRKRDMYFTDEDIKGNCRPTGICITCHTFKIED